MTDMYNMQLDVILWKLARCILVYFNKLHIFIDCSVVY